MGKKCANKTKASVPPAAPRGVVGVVVMAPLDSVRPNGWNPNQMSKQMEKSFREGLRKDGWLASQALLIWESDENGVSKGLIIDGEHRWTAARELGLTEGPMVHLRNLPEAEAKALTIKMNQKRGEFNEGSLTALLESIAPSFDVGELGVELGFEQSAVDKMLGSWMDAQRGVPEAVAPPPRVDASMVGALPNLRVPLTFYVPNEELEDLLEVFRNPQRPTELRADLLREMVAMWRAAQSA